MLVLASNACMWLTALSIDARIQPLSRRACNAAYVAWSLALCDTWMSVFACLDFQESWLKHSLDHR